MTPLKPLSPKSIQRIVRNIPEGANKYRHGLLNKVLRSWSDNDVKEYEGFSELLKRRQKTKTKIENLIRAAKLLESCLRDGAKAGDFDYIGLRLKRQSASLNNIDDIEKSILVLRVNAEQALQTFKRGRGQPKNQIAQLVISDIAAIYEWLYKKKATSVTDRITGEEIGLFEKFAKIIWRGTFGVDSVGLSFAIRQLNASDHADFRFSPIIANINLRHADWRVFGS
jgi:hypothetical protein